MNSRRKFVQLVTAIGVASALSAAPARAAKALKCSLYVPLDSLQGKAAQQFKQLVEKKTGGALEIRLFPSNQLGGPYDVIDAQSAGSIEMSLLGYDIYAKFSPVVNLAGLPFIFRDRKHAFAFFVTKPRQLLEIAQHVDVGHWVARPATLSDPAVKLRGVKVAARIVDQARGDAVLEFDKTNITALHAAQSIPYLLGANAAHGATGDLANDVDLMRALIEDRAERGFELRGRPGTRIELVEIPRIDHHQVANFTALDDLAHLANGRIEIPVDKRSIR